MACGDDGGDDDGQGGPARGPVAMATESSQRTRSPSILSRYSVQRHTHQAQGKKSVSKRPAGSR